jgi:hypothetical protein
MMHDALGLIFLTPDGENPAAKWEETFRCLGAAENRILRDFYDKKKLHLHYLVNFHMAVGLALADGAYATQGANRASLILHRVFRRALDMLKFDDRLQDAFYKKIIRILVCKSYIYSVERLDENAATRTVNDQDTTNSQENSPFSELVGYLKASQSIPMLCFEILEALLANGFKMKNTCDLPELMELVRDAYTSAIIVDKNNHWKFREGKNIEELCKRRLDSPFLNTD